MAQEIGGGTGSSGGDKGGGGCGCRQRTAPPAFLTKTYQIVDDPNTNYITSWGKYGESFIIWDHIKFSAQILPKYFRHNNFASFVYQLNNYGFRKIGVEHQWEYMSPYFQKQKQHLLANMKRRSEQNPTHLRRQSNNSLCPEMMRDAMNESKLEIEKMKVQQLDMDFHIMALQQEAKTINNSTNKMIVSWAKACGILAKRGREEIGNQNCDDHDHDHDEAVAKRKKLVGFAEISTKDNGTDPFVDEMVEEMTTPLSQIQPIDDHLKEHVSNLKSETGSSYLDFFKKIMLEDDEVCEVIMLEDDQVCEVEAVNNKHAEISQDFQDLFTGFIRD